MGEMEAVCQSGASWRIDTTAAGDTIWLTFAGPTRTHEIPAFIDALNAVMPDSSAKIVFDLRGLDGYNPETKEPMKAWLLEHKLAIEELTVVLPKSRTFLRMVVAAISLATGVKIRLRDDADAVGQPVPAVSS